MAQVSRKSLLRTLAEMLAIWLVCLLAGSSCAVFYTQSNNNDFPRLGRRSIFTAAGDDKDGAYPRIGRSLSSPDAALSSLYDASFQPALVHKRGIFTASGPGFPRIGRAQSKRSRNGKLLSAVPDVMASVDVPQGVRGSEEEEETEDGVVDGEREGMASRFEYPLGLMFFELDKDGDKSLTRDEFVQGMARARQDRTLFR